jgi:hypothetical protein
MRKVKKMLIFEIILLVIVFLLIVLYFFKSASNLPHTQVILTNTTILGKVLGL